MRFQLLGPVQAWAADQPISLGPRKQRFVFAVLALELNSLVPVFRLVDLGWPDGPPPSARSMIHTYVSNVRAVLAQHHADRDEIELTGESGGYRLCCDPGLVDAHRFRDLLLRARGEPDDKRRLDLLTDALGLWHGPALSGVASEPIRARLGGHLDEARVSAVEDRVEALLRLDLHGGLIEELMELAEQHPYRQRLTGQLMLALHRAGRTAEALQTYERARRRFADELGLDPGADLRRLHQSILRATTGPGGPPGGPPAAPPPRPAQLPADLATFVGRAAELEHLLGVLPGADQPATTVVISSIEGMAGIGKTALAVHAAHRLAPRYPDGQLFVDMHGFTPGVAPVQPADALERVLLALGLPAEAVPASLDDRAALLRTTLHHRRVLLLVDNVTDEAQVLPLLPGASGCLVLITSRRRLSGLDDVSPLPLDLLAGADARSLFTRISGVAEPADQVAEIVELCGRLPLAIRIAAARLRSRPSWTAAHLAERLRDGAHRLAELAHGQRSVAAALDVSYQHLDAEQQRGFRLLGGHPAATVDRYAFAALAGSTVWQAGRLLDDLVDAHLLDEPAPGRYRLHDLLRAHAAQTAAAVDADADRRAALTRLFDYYAQAAATATALLYPFEPADQPRPPAGTHLPPLPDQAAAGDWLGAELGNLLAAAAYAGAHGWPRHVLALSRTLHRYLRSRARYVEAGALHHTALAAARAVASRDGQLQALVGLGDVRRLTGRPEQAVDFYQQAVRIAADIGHGSAESTAYWGLGHIDVVAGRHGSALERFQRALDIAGWAGYRAGESIALYGLGHVHLLTARHGQAADCFERARALAHQIGDRTAEFNALSGLGHIHRIAGRHEQAIGCFQQSLDIAHAAGQPSGELTALCGLGEVHRLAGRYQEAADCFGQSLELARQTGYRTGELSALSGLGDVHRLAGRHQQAADCFGQSMDLARQTGDRNALFEALHGLGHTLAAAGRSADAVARHQEALDIARELDQPHDQARAHSGLATAQHALGDVGAAREHWEQALVIFTELGTPERADVAAKLAQLSNG